MRSRRFLYSAALCTAFLSGCQWLQSYRPVSVVAVDAETKKPIPGAVVRISYPVTPGYRSPSPASGETGADGAVRLRAAPIEDGLDVEANAPGYLLEERSLSGQVVQDPQPAPVVLEMYAAPRPTVELVLPLGFRGLVHVETRIRDDLPYPPGQRCFRYDVPASGVVQLTGPALSGGVPAVRACYTDGTLLAADAPDLDVGFRWVRSENNYELYMVGTRVECDALKRAPDGVGRTSDGEKAPGRGRRGSPSPSDSGTALDSPNKP